MERFVSVCKTRSWKIRKQKRRIFSLGIKHTSEHHKYDEFMCIMYEAITKRNERYVDKQTAKRSRDLYVTCVTLRRWDRVFGEATECFHVWKFCCWFVRGKTLSFIFHVASKLKFCQIPFFTCSVSLHPCFSNPFEDGIKFLLWNYVQIYVWKTKSLDWCSFLVKGFVCRYRTWRPESALYERCRKEMCLTGGVSVHLNPENVYYMSESQTWTINLMHVLCWMFNGCSVLFLLFLLLLVTFFLFALSLFPLTWLLVTVTVIASLMKTTMDKDCQQIVFVQTFRDIY